MVDYKLGHPDKYVERLQAFYSQLGEIAREVVLVPQMYYYWTLPSPINTLNRRLLTGKSLSSLCQSYTVRRSFRFDVSSVLLLARAQLRLAHEQSSAGRAL